MTDDSHPGSNLLERGTVYDADSGSVATVPRKAVLFGLFGMGNYGNDATLYVTLDELRRRWGDVDISCVCEALPPSVEEFRLSALPLDPLPPKGGWRIGFRPLRYLYWALAYPLTEPWRKRRILKSLQGVDTFIVVGTGVLDDFGMLPWDLPAWLWRWTKCAREVGANVIFLAVGAGPIRNPLNLRLMLDAVRMADARTYRDTVSQSFLTKHGIDTREDPVVPDLVFGISRDLLPTAVDVPVGRRTIGVGVMGYYGWRNDASLGQPIYRNYIAKITEFVCWLIGQGCAVQLLIGEVPADLRALQDVTAGVASRLGREPAELLTGAIDSFADLVGKVAQCDAVVATRYHNVICALALGRPVIALGYATKFNALMEEVGMGDFCTGVEDFDVQSLIALFGRMTNEKDRLAATIRQSTDRFRSDLERLYGSLFGEGGPV